MSTSQTKICCIPYYREHQYDQLSQISIDKETFSVSFEELMDITELKYKEMETKGFKVVKIDVDLDELIEWCNSQDLSINTQSRTHFAMAKLKEMLANNEIDY